MPTEDYICSVCSFPYIEHDEIGRKAHGLEDVKGEETYEELKMFKYILNKLLESQEFKDYVKGVRR